MATKQTRKTTKIAAKSRKGKTTRVGAKSRSVVKAKSTTKTAARAKPKARKRTTSVATKLRKQLVRKGLQQAIYVVTIFLVLFALSLIFLLYQWKDYQIVEYGKDIQQLKTQILRLNSENSRYQASINTELLNNKRIARISKEKLGLHPSIEEQMMLKVDKGKLNYYALKDEKTKD